MSVMCTRISKNRMEMYKNWDSQVQHISQYKAYIIWARGEHIWNKKINIIKDNEYEVITKSKIHHYIRGCEIKISITNCWLCGLSITKLFSITSAKTYK